MKRIKALYVSATLALAAVSAPAFAAKNLDVVDGNGVFSHAQIAKGAINDTFNFTTTNVLESVNLTYFATRISSLSAFFNSTPITFTKQTDGSFFGSLTKPVAAGQQTLLIKGVASGNGASYTGNLSAVPEPASWALMIVGMGVAGTMRRRRRTTAALTA